MNGESLAQQVVNQTHDLITVPDPGSLLKRKKIQVAKWGTQIV